MNAGGRAVHHEHVGRSALCAIGHLSTSYQEPDGTRARRSANTGARYPQWPSSPRQSRLGEALRESDEATLTLTDAARESGYSTDHLGRLVR